MERIKIKERLIRKIQQMSLQDILRSGYGVCLTVFDAQDLLGSINRERRRTEFEDARVKMLFIEWCKENNADIYGPEFYLEMGKKSGIADGIEKHI